MEETHTAKGKIDARMDDANFIFRADFRKQSTILVSDFVGDLGRFKYAP
jgi:hypothetical protein